MKEIRNTKGKKVCEIDEHNQTVEIVYKKIKTIITFKKGKVVIKHIPTI